jgi:hypothetical protein
LFGDLKPIHRSVKLCLKFFYHTISLGYFANP